MAEILFSEPFQDVFDELSARDQALIIDHFDLLQSFPEMYPVRDTGPKVFRGLRCFVAGNWHVY